ncbi:MAG: aminotransferase class IV [Reichenbachiella sp.]|uniref:aminotransferase class IV n=1 Tax=Reichenbachiella sp. TaxID=2184521 RepID=UPI003299D0E7
MSQFIESIRCINGELQLLELHQARVNRTFFTNYGLLARPIKLAIIIRQIPASGTFKCRVVYDQNSFEITYDKYQKPNINSCQIVKSEDIDYRFKYADRSGLANLFAQRKDADDIIIVKEGMISDSYFANLAFFDGEDWWTPESPLLAGVQRQNLLDQRLIKTREIHVNELTHFKKVSLINAMNDLGKIEFEISEVIH